MSVTGDDILEKIVTDDMSSDFIYLKYDHDADEKILVSPDSLFTVAPWEGVMFVFTKVVEWLHMAVVVSAG